MGFEGVRSEHMYSTVTGSTQSLTLSGQHTKHHASPIQWQRPNLKNPARIPAQMSPESGHDDSWLSSSLFRLISGVMGWGR